jgi:formylglycine-generating enzyme required for sulfatase activity
MFGRRSARALLFGSVVALALGCERPPQGMVLVPAGAFIIGSTRQDTEGTAAQFSLVKPLYLDEQPQHSVTLASFFIDRTEVTQRQYEAFVVTTARPAPSHWRGGRAPADRAEHPVTHVSWFDADAYCRWAGKRLPREAEWEKAARGDDAREYPWGNTFEADAANTGDAGRETTAPVGQFPRGRSPYGADDMAGNVMEWVADWYQPYPGATHASPLYGERFKVVRGGSYGGQGGHYALQVFYRAAFRFYAEPRDRYPDIGFRCARDPRRWY